MMGPGLTNSICVIGGGPAGSTIAKQLSELGHEVYLVEKEAFPRPHVGICLSEPTLILFHHLGVAERISRESFWERKQVLLKWNTQVARVVNQPGMHVDRGVLDSILLNAARGSGVKVIQPAKVTTAKRNLNTGWDITIKSNQHSFTKRFRFVVDASGRSSILKGKSKRFAPPLIALHTILKLRNRTEQDGLMQSSPNSWIWTAQLSPDRLMVSLYCDPKQVSGGTISTDKFFFNSVEAFKIREYFDYESLGNKVKVCDASSRYSLQPVGTDYIMVGDSALSVDPMASQGVHLAISSAIQAASVVNTILRYPSNINLAIEFYSKAIKEKVTLFMKRTEQEYAKAAQLWKREFWIERTNRTTKSNPSVIGVTLPHLNTLVGICSQAKLRPTPAIVDDRVVHQTALFHPRLQRPVAFLSGFKIEDYLKLVEEKCTVRELLDIWNKNIPNQKLNKQVFKWMWKYGIFVKQ